MKLSPINIVLTILSVIVVMVFYVAIVHAVQFVLPITKEMGQFGDSFGGLNAFFTGLAMLAAMSALYFQIREFRELKKSNQLVVDTQQTLINELIESNKNLAHGLAMENIDRRIKELSASIVHFDKVESYIGPQSSPITYQDIHESVQWIFYNELAICNRPIREEFTGKYGENSVQNLYDAIAVIIEGEHRSVYEDSDETQLEKLTKYTYGLVKHHLTEARAELGRLQAILSSSEKIGSSSASAPIDVPDDLG